MSGEITHALALENEGRVEEAKNIYKNILAAQPDNFKAAAHLRRLSKEEGELNKDKLRLFININSEQNLKEFKRWLIQL